MSKRREEQSKNICKSIEISIVYQSRLFKGYSENPRIELWGSFLPYRQMERYNLSKDSSIQLSSFNNNNNNHNYNNNVKSFKTFSKNLNDGEETTEGEGKENKVFECELDTSIYKSNELVIIEDIFKYDEMRGDEMINSKLIADTRYSGIDQIDKKELKYVTRGIQNGCCQLELYDIFKNYVTYTQSLKKTTTKNQKDSNNIITITGAFRCPKVFQIKVNELVTYYNKHQIEIDHNIEKAIIDEAFDFSNYGFVHFNVNVKGFNYDNYKKSIMGKQDLRETAIHSSISLNNRKREFFQGDLNNDSSSSSSSFSIVEKSTIKYKALLYNSQKASTQRRNAMENLLGEYFKAFIEVNGNKPKYPPVNQGVSQLQMPFYNSELGQLPVHCFWTSMVPQTREYYDDMIKLKELEYYSFNEKTEQYFELLARSALNRYGLSEEVFIKEVNRHYDIKNEDTTVSELFILCQEAILDMGTEIGNMVDYTSDYRYVKANDQKSTIKSINEKLKLSHSDSYKMINHHHYQKQSHDYITELHQKIKATRLNLDSFDSPALLGWSSAGDCEDSCQTATMVLETLGFGRFDLNNKWESKLLTTIKLFIDETIIWYNGGTVTSAYMDTTGKPLDMKDKKTDLPIRGSEMDLNCVTDGHCYGLAISKTKCKKFLSYGNINKETLDKIKLSNETESFIKRDSSIEISVIEGTGSIKSHVLPSEESYSLYPTMLEKESSERHFIKAIKISITEFDKKNNQNSEQQQQQQQHLIMDLINFEGLPYYFKKQDPNRRISSFFDRTIHGITMDFRSMDPHGLNQFAFCKTVGNRKMYGVTMAELTRDQLKGDVSLVAPYFHSSQNIKENTIQMIESIQNQLPIMQFGLYKEEEYKQLYTKFIPFTSEGLLSIDKIGINQYEKESIEFKKKLGQVCLNKNQTIIHFDSRSWKFSKSKETTENFIKVVNSMKGIVDIGVFEHKFIPVLEKRVEILCIIDIKETLNNVINE